MEMMQPEQEYQQAQQYHPQQQYQPAQQPISPQVETHELPGQGGKN
jgi:hypothetical protein